MADTDIPSDIMEAAMGYVGQPVTGDNLTPREVIATYVARAILAERLAERERCAGIIEPFTKQGGIGGAYIRRATWSMLDAVRQP